MQRIYCKFRVIHSLISTILYHLLGFHVLCIFLDIFKYNFQFYTIKKSVICFSGAYHNKTGLNGQGLSDHMLFGSVVATTLVIVVTAQVRINRVG